VIIFLFVPTRRAERVSAAFRRWSDRDRLTAWAQRLARFAFVVGLGPVLGWDAWRFAWPYPFLAFAWAWSRLVRVFHDHRTIGEHTRLDLRALRRHGVLSWLRLNFNQHASHRMAPNVRRYQPPERRQELPEPLRVGIQDTDHYWRAILQQLAGPTIVYAKDAEPTPHLVVRWED